jgi:GAF domain-containing protein
MMQGQAERLINPMLLLDPILDELKTVVEFDSVTVMKATGAYSVTVGHRGDTPLAEALRSSFPAQIPQPSLDWYRRFVPLLMADVLDEAPETQQFRLNIRRLWGKAFDRMLSVLCVPLLVGDQLVGLLGLDHHVRGHFTPRDVDLVQAFVKRKAREIEHAILYADAARQADEAQAVLTVQQAIVRRHDPDAILRKVAEEVLRLTAARRALVFLCKEEQFRLASAAGAPLPWLPVGWGWQTPTASSLLGRALETGEPLSFDSLED